MSGYVLGSANTPELGSTRLTRSMHPALFATMAASTTTSSRSALSSLQLPRLGLGMAALGRPGYINLGHSSDIADRSVEAMRKAAHDTLDAAYEAGIRYIDCARSYGLSEDFVASWLATRPELASSVTVGSKWGYEYTAAWRVQVDEGESHEVKKLTVEQLTRQLEESKALLPGLALYQIHSASLDVLQAPALPPPPPPASNSTQFLLRHRHCPIHHHRTRRCSRRSASCATPARSSASRYRTRRPAASSLAQSPPRLPLLELARDLPVVSQVPTIEAAIAVEVGGAPLFGAVQARAAAAW